MPKYSWSRLTEILVLHAESGEPTTRMPGYKLKGLVHGYVEVVAKVQGRTVLYFLRSSYLPVKLVPLRDTTPNMACAEAIRIIMKRITELARQQVVDLEQMPSWAEQHIAGAGKKELAHEQA